MKRLTCILLSILMLLSLTACAQEPDPEGQAFQAACALLEEGKYQEAYAAFTALDSYRRIQEKIDQSLTGMEQQRLAQEEAARQALLEKVGFLYGTTWRDIGSTTELTFGELADEGYGGPFVGEVHFLDWMDATTRWEADYIWYLTEEGILISYLPELPQEDRPELGYPVTVEERDGTTHLLVGGYDFIPAEAYGPYEPASVQITMDNWQEYFEIREGFFWEKDDFGAVCGVRLITALCLKETYQDRVVLERTSVTFGYTYDDMGRAVQKIDFQERIAQTGGITFIYNTDTPATRIFGLENYDLTTDNDSVAELPQVYCQLTSGFYSPASTHFGHQFFTYEDHVIDRAAGTLMLRPE